MAKDTRGTLEVAGVTVVGALTRAADGGPDEQRLTVYALDGHVVLATPATADGAAALTLAPVGTAELQHRLPALLTAHDG